MMRKLAPSEKWPNNLPVDLIHACCFNCNRKGVLHGNIKYHPYISTKFYCIDCIDRCLPFIEEIETAENTFGDIGGMDR